MNRAKIDFARPDISGTFTFPKVDSKQEGSFHGFNVSVTIPSSPCNDLLFMLGDYGGLVVVTPNGEIAEENIYKNSIKHEAQNFSLLRNKDVRKELRPYGWYFFDEKTYKEGDSRMYDFKEGESLFRTIVIDDLIKSLSSSTFVKNYEKELTLFKDLSQYGEKFELSIAGKPRRDKGNYFMVANYKDVEFNLTTLEVSVYKDKKEQRDFAKQIVFPFESMGFTETDFTLIERYSKKKGLNFNTYNNRFFLGDSDGLTPSEFDTPVLMEQAYGLSKLLDKIVKFNKEIQDKANYKLLNQKLHLIEQ